MNQEVTEKITLFDHTRLPFKHKIQHPLDMADSRLYEAEQRLKNRLETVTERMVYLHKQAMELDPDGNHPTERSERLFDLHDRAADNYHSLGDRLEIVQSALTAISRASSTSHNHRLKTVKLRKRRASK